MLSSGMSLTKICQCDGMPLQKTVLDWAKDPTHPFSGQYARSRDMQLDLFVDQIIDIADNTEADMAEIQKARLKIDAIKWVACKLAPKKYGDKVVQELTGPNGQPLAGYVNRMPDLRKLEDQELTPKVLEIIAKEKQITTSKKE
jgi:hypothetical protein